MAAGENNGEAATNGGNNLACKKIAKIAANAYEMKWRIEA